MRWPANIGIFAPSLAHIWTSFVQSKEKQSTNHKDFGKWDEDWDGRSPESLFWQQNSKYIDQETTHQKELMHHSKSVRNIILIRHGQYEDLSKTEEGMRLTETGRRQAAATGRRLNELRRSGLLPFTTLTSSTMLRAMQTADLIAKELIADKEAPALTRSVDVFLCEGTPCLPDPDINPFYLKHKLLEESTRIEAAFRRYFYRAPPEQETDSYEVLACHAHVIRYFVVRALQFPPQGWIRLTIPHASITWIRILPNGQVVLQWFANTGHLPPELVTLGLEHK